MLNGYARGSASWKLAWLSGRYNAFIRWVIACLGVFYLALVILFISNYIDSDWDQLTSSPYHSSQKKPPPHEDELVLRRVVENENGEFHQRCIANQPSECIHIVIAATGSYLPALMACMNSVQMNTNRSLFFHVLTAPGETTLLRNALMALSEFNGGWPIEFAEFNDKRVKPLIRVWEGKHMNVYTNTFNYARYYLPFIFPSIASMIYLDPDTIVNDGVDIGELYELFVRRYDRSKQLAAVPSKTKVTDTSSYCFLLNCQDPHVAAIIKNPNDKFFNAGVFATNLTWWKETKITEQLESWMRINRLKPLWIWGSQAPLALVFYDKWMELSSHWNERSLRKAHTRKNQKVYEYLLEKSKLFHFVGKSKPWKANGRRIWSIWCKYYPLRDTLWFCSRSGKWDLVSSNPWEFNFVHNLHDEESLVALHQWMLKHLTNTTIDENEFLIATAQPTKPVAD